MANYVKLSNGIYVGTTADTKPVNNTVPNGTILLEFDTAYRQHVTYTNDGTFWNPDFQCSPTHGRWGCQWGWGSGTANTEGSCLLTTNNLNGGAFNTGSVNSNGQFGRHQTGVTINGMVGNRMGAISTQRDLNPFAQWKFIISAATTVRGFFGLSSAVTAPAVSTDYLANLSGIGFWIDTGVDANWHIAQNSGGASSDRTTITVAAADTSVHTYAIRADNANTKFMYSYDGGAWTNINTVIPAATTTMTYTWYLESTAGSASRNLDFYYFVYRQNA